MKTQIAFMFLGGLPNPTEDSGKCWKNFIKNSSQKYFKKIVFVVHPINPSEKLSGFWKKCLTFDLNSTSKIKTIYLNTPDTHLKTAWATRSLVDATILMIKTSYQLFPNIKKFVLLEGKTCPLYNLKIICDTLLTNDKNWLDPLNNSCKDEFINNKHPNLYCPTKECLKKKDCSFWSQWMVLDAKYIKNLLDTNVQKDDEPVTCNNGSVIDQITVKNTSTKISKSIQTSLVQMLDIYNKPCQFADELYFGLMLKKGRTINQFINIINTIDKDKFITDSTSIKYLNNNQTYIQPIQSVSLINSTSGILEYKESFYKIKPVGMQNHYNRNSKYTSSLPFYLSSISFNDKVLTDEFTLCPVYTDWRFFNTNPFNIFRSFKYKNLNINNLLNDTNFKTINLLLNLEAENVSFDSLNLNQLPYWSHPLEYNTIPLYQYINGYNILSYFSSINNDGHLKYLLSLYKIAIKNIGFKFIERIKIFSDDTFPLYKFLITPINSKMLVGTFITNETLNSARMRGCLFIRKCEKGSNIHKYADQLYKKTKYIYKNIL
jgi:hypothetical protein